jgi:hypothetical protein
MEKFEKKSSVRQRFLRRPRALTLTISVPSLLVSPKVCGSTQAPVLRRTFLYKGIVAPEFLTLVFFMNRPHMDP